MQMSKDERIKGSKEPKILETVQEDTIKESKAPKIPEAVRELLTQRLSLLDGPIKKCEGKIRPDREIPGGGLKWMHI